MGRSSSMVEIERMSSIEEPRTLYFHEIKFAREAALYVMKTRSKEEALRIFTEGLEPVVCRTGMNNIGDALMDSEEEWFNEQAIPVPKDIVSAPF